MQYSPSELLKNAWSLILTKIFFPSARLVRRPVYIRGRMGMSFGSGFTTGYGCRFEMLHPEGKQTLHIGKNCKMGDRVHICALESVTIGDDCLLASNIFISDTDHGSGKEDPLTPPDLRPLTAKNVSIGRSVWIGEGVAILPGAKIGNGCIIGAHSVVKGEIPDFTIAVGAPAKPVKRYQFETKTWERL